MSTSENLTLYNLNDRNEMDLWLFKALDLADERRIWVWAVGCELGPCTSKLLLQILKMAQRLGRSSDRSKTQRARGFTRVFRSIPAVGEGHESISGSNRSSISFQFISNVEIMSNCLLPFFFFGLGKRKASISCSRRFFFRALSIAAAGSGLLYAESNSDYNATVSLSVPAPLSESLSLPWTFHLIPLRPSFTSPDNWHFGILPLFSSRVSPVPSTDREKECPGVAGDSSKPSCGCLGRDTIANAAARVGPAVVNLSVPQGFYGITTGKSIGSGTIIDSDGTILTCAHVVVDFQGMRGSSKGKVDVTLQDGCTFEGTVVNADLHSDIAIVKIKSKTPLPTAKLGSSSKLRPGDWVLAMGCPLSLQNTVTAGIVSCVDRKSSDLGLGGMRREYLQTDCAINAGNSGGPLVNVDGQVVGVNIMKVLAADGLSFAVPIDSVIKIIEHFKKSGRVVRPWLGLKMIDLNEMIIAQLKDRDPRFPNVDRGVLVPMVTPGSPADRAGFHPGDVVIEFDGKPVESIKEIIEIMGDRVGIPLKTVVKRPNDILVTLTVIPEEANPDM